MAFPHQDGILEIIKVTKLLFPRAVFPHIYAGEWHREKKKATINVIFLLIVGESCYSTFLINDFAISCPIYVSTFDFKLLVCLMVTHRIQCHPVKNNPEGSVQQCFNKAD
jgi:hypothetical protein